MCYATAELGLGCVILIKVHRVGICGNYAEILNILLGDGLAALRSHTDLKLGACKLFAFVRHNYILLLYFWNLLKFKSHGTFGEYACIHELEVG